jgi:hypothetical protein
LLALIPVGHRLRAQRLSIPVDTTVVCFLDVTLRGIPAPLRPSSQHLKCELQHFKFQQSFPILFNLDRTDHVLGVDFLGTCWGLSLEVHAQGSFPIVKAWQDMYDVLEPDFSKLFEK